MNSPAGVFTGIHTVVKPGLSLVSHSSTTVNAREFCPRSVGLDDRIVP